MTEIIIAAVFICLYAVLDGLADAFIFRDMRNTPESAADMLAGFWRNRAQSRALVSHDFNTNWHRAQAAQQGAVILATAYLSGCWQLIVLGAGLFWLIHDGIVNRLGLDRPFFFVGTTAWINRMFQKTGKPELMMGIAKVFLILAGIISFFVKF